jgi:hypothetical protein
MSILGPPFTLDALVECLVIGVGTMSGILCGLSEVLSICFEKKCTSRESCKKTPSLAIPYAVSYDE